MKRFLCGVLAVLLPAAMCACGKQETATVRLSEVTHSVFYAPQYVALEQGFFADEGLKIELTNGGGADKVMTAVLTGQADIGLAGPEACIYVYNQGKDDHPIVFGQLTKRDGSFLVGREDVPFSWELLRGRTVIGGRAGGVPEMTLEYVMRQNGIVPGVDAGMQAARALPGAENHNVAGPGQAFGDGLAGPGLVNRNSGHAHAVLSVSPPDQAGTVKAFLRRSAAQAILFAHLAVGGVNHFLRFDRCRSVVRRAKHAAAGQKQCQKRSENASAPETFLFIVFSVHKLSQQYIEIFLHCVRKLSHGFLLLFSARCAKT